MVDVPLPRTAIAMFDGRVYKITSPPEWSKMDGAICLAKTRRNSPVKSAKLTQELR